MFDDEFDLPDEDNYIYQTQQIQQKAEFAVGRRACDLGHKYEHIGGSKEAIDAELWIASSNPSFSPIIGIQIKGSETHQINKDGTVSISVKTSTLKRWKQYGHPVILVVCLIANPSHEEQIIWKRVDNLSKTRIRIEIGQRFDETTHVLFPQIINQYHTNNVLNFPIKGVSDVLADLDFGSTTEQILRPIERKVIQANKMFLLENYKDAKRIYEALAAIYENAYSVWHNWVVTLASLQDYHQAIEIARQVINKWPDKWEAYILLGGCLSASTSLEEAEQYFLEAVKLAPLSDNTWNILGLFHYWQGRYKEAIEELNVAVSYNLDNFAAYFNLALCTTALENYEQALMYYDKCIAIESKLYDAYHNKGLLLKWLGRVWEALEYFDKAIEACPSEPGALYSSAFLLKDLGYNERAVERYHMALERGLEGEYVYCDLAMLYCRVANWDAARKYFYKTYECLKKQNDNLVDRPWTILDLGYTVAYVVELYIFLEKINIVKVELVPEMAVFNLFRQNDVLLSCLENAHLLNVPLLIKEPRLSFKFDLKKTKGILKSWHI